MGQADVAFFECSSCGGLWIEREIFEALADHARSGKLPEGFAGGAPAAADPDTWEPRFRYRSCVTCGTLMNRRNYGRRSGVIVDVCARHGLWFDLHELERLLRWIHEGGEAQAERLEQEQARVEARRKLPPNLRPSGQPASGEGHSPWTLGEVLPDLIGAVRWFFE
jgi:Zn-finger nucleic acid-binding protein